MSEGEETAAGDCGEMVGLETLLMEPETDESISSGKKKASVFRSFRKPKPSKRLVRVCSAVVDPEKEFGQANDDRSVMEETSGLVQAEGTSDSKQGLQEDASKRTQASSQEKSALQPKLPKRIWKSHMDPNTERRYYYNRLTRQSTWTRPDTYGVPTRGADKGNKKDDAKQDQVVSQDEDNQKEDTNATKSEETENSYPSQDRDSIEIDIVGVPVAWDGEALLDASTGHETPVGRETKNADNAEMWKASEEYEMKKGRISKRFSFFKSRSKVAALDNQIIVEPAMAEGREENEETVVNVVGCSRS